jgi:hypothetical protein
MCIFPIWYTVFGRFRIFVACIDDVVDCLIIMCFCRTDGLANPSFFTGITAAAAVAFWGDAAAARDA